MEFEYDKAGQIVRRRTPGALEESFCYDRCGRLIEHSLEKPSHTLFLRGYKYDLEGNLIELSDSKKGASRFAYDPVERLREVTRPEREIERFVYDSTGNLSRRGGREFRYGQPDRLTRADDATLVYDEAGNLTEKRRAGSVIRYSYDPDNRLIAVESNEGGRVEFAYDAFGRRIAKQAKDHKFEFLWDGCVLLNERRDDKSNEYVFNLDSFEPLCRFDENGFETYHNDHLGTPHELTDETGEIVWSASYDVYGSLTSTHKNDSENQIRFQGQYEDYETSLYYNQFRYYAPDAGRYITQDPIGLDGGLNLYGYASPNPIHWIDPFGLSVADNAAAGDRREAQRLRELKRQFPGDSVQAEQYLRGADGKIKIDRLTGEARRLDFVVISKDGTRIRRAEEVTSLSATKTAQAAKEGRIRAAGGVYIRDRRTRKLVKLGKRQRIYCVRKK
jgi:RHS repeat-associated protein